MLKRIAIESLRPGMFVEELCGSWFDHPFWRTRFPVRQQDDIDRLRQGGVRELWIDTGRGADVPAEAVASHSPATTREDSERDISLRLAAADDERAGTAVAPKPVSSEDEIDRAMRIVHRSALQVEEACRSVSLGLRPDLAAGEAVARDIMATVSRSVATAAALARLKGDHDYAYRHAVAVSALAFAVARRLGLDEEQCRHAALAGLVHDIGMATLPAEWLEQGQDLDDAQWAKVRQHPERSAHILRESGAPAAVIEACRHHHERTDGSGYPDALKGDEIPLLARIIAVCDVYDAMASDRPWRRGMAPGDAMRKLAEWNTQFDDRVFKAFVRVAGIYPLGAVVRLASQRVAVVVDHRPDNLMKPLVKIFFSLRAQAYLPPELLDLARPDCRDRIIEQQALDGFDRARIDEIWAGGVPRRRRPVASKAA